MTMEAESPGSPAWRRVWEATGRIPFAHPSFAGLFAPSGARVCGLTWRDADGEVLLPLVVRSLPPELTDGTDTTGWRDAVSVYGYGGPFVTGSPDLGRFYQDLLKWLREQKVVTAFLRCPVVDERSTLVVQRGYRRLALAENVVVDLTRPAEERWHHYEQKVRKNVKKARRHGLVATISSTFGDPGGFQAVYDSTMARRGAADFYRFDVGWFAELERLLPESIWVAEVRDDGGRLVSAELVLRGDRYCYSFLGGTLADAFAMAPNDLLKHEVIDYAAAAGLRGFVLGGGYAVGDGIFRYKRAFDPTGVVPFHVVQLTSDAGLYEQLCVARGVSNGFGDFFPAYRTPPMDG